MLRLGGLLVEAGNFSDLCEVSISPTGTSARKTRASWESVGRTCRLRSQHAADGEVHEALSLARFCHPSLSTPRSRGRNGKGNRPGFDEGNYGAMDLISLRPVG
jgi:hypothetical protein